MYAAWYGHIDILPECWKHRWDVKNSDGLTVHNILLNNGFKVPDIWVDPKLLER